MKQLNQLMQEIITNNVPHLNVFAGEEVALIKLYQSKILELGYTPVICDSVSSVVSKLSKKSIDKSKKCYIILDDMDFIKAEKVWEKVIKIVNSSKDILILKYFKLDKRKAFYKFFEPYIVNFEKMSDEVLFKHTSNNLKGASDKTIKNLVEICENDYSRILLEIDKIKQYANATGKELDGSFKTLDEQGVIYKPIGDITFKFTDAILTGDYDRTDRYLYQAKLKQEPAILVLSVLYNGFKEILLYQGLGADKSNATKRTGLTSWQIKQAQSKMGAYSIAELVRALRVITNIEQGIKTGLVDEDVALELAILNIM